ncbi:hypothetical protein WJX75_008027 [Coccomyxa subellipsoidea]|uniref:Uncharacterized protein n=1 Tax=Coccomyxa subellipsoidea TaxID=248742 RepID=A0ABR2YAE1_9CHLO
MAEAALLGAEQRLNQLETTITELKQQIADRPGTEDPWDPTPTGKRRAGEPAKGEPAKRKATAATASAL